jgi:uncharacterized protein (DUF983 family)
MFDGWFAQRQRCDACGFRFDRNEEEDYWLGAYLLNFMATEVLFALLLGVVLLATWPRAPWQAIIWVGAVQMIATPILSYPLTKALWLAGDLIFRPPTEADFAQLDEGG